MADQIASIFTKLGVNSWEVNSARRPAGRWHDEPTQQPPSRVHCRTEFEGSFADGSKLTRDDAVGLAITVIWAAQANASTTTMWALLDLFAKENTEHLARVRAEMQRLPTSMPYEGLMAETPHTGRCIRESMRVHPRVHIIPRMVIQECRVGPYRLPRGHLVAIAPVLSHVVEAHFPNPEQYDPDRVYEEDSFLGFGSGRHRCLGERLAYLLMKSIVGKVVRDYDIELLQPTMPEVSQDTQINPVHAQCAVRYTRRQSPGAYVAQY